eukprot:TRINITY_DN1159_c0_g7_i1.p1 TRINITY_DN1159_c0_g7~~TRINITY_DN1159_c0_g7_i1.p1  ORF type:complete len:420 (+),score=148.54 TRINITY_DN1159_c0_g7_i1:183-1442(+)
MDGGCCVECAPLLDPPVSLAQLCTQGLDSVVREYFKKFDSVQVEADPADEYDVRRVLGTGAFGLVHRVVHRRTGAKRAMKAIELPATDMTPTNCALWQGVMGEVAVLASIREQGGLPNLIGLRDLRFHAGTLYVVTDLAAGVTLHQYAAAELPSERRASEICYHVLRGLLALHARGIVHGDVKPENVMVARNPRHRTAGPWNCQRVSAGPASYLCHSDTCDEFVVKLVDYGSVRFPADAGTDAPVFGGTSMYLAVEVIDLLLRPTGGGGKAAGAASGQLTKSDMFSLGVMGFILLCRMHPFRGTAVDDLQGLRAKMSQGVDYPPYVEDQISSGVKDFLAALLHLDPEDRPGALAALRHPWIEKRGLLPGIPPCSELATAKMCSCSASKVYTAPEDRFTAAAASCTPTSSASDASTLGLN